MASRTDCPKLSGTDDSFLFFYARRYLPCMWVINLNSKRPWLGEVRGSNTDKTLPNSLKWIQAKRGGVQNAMCTMRN